MITTLVKYSAQLKTEITMSKEFDVELLNSSRDGDIEGVIHALNNRGSKDRASNSRLTPLLAAAKNGHTDICGILLAAGGADVNEIESDTLNTALHFAVLDDNKALVEALLSWGAKVDQQAYCGDTALYLACQEGYMDCFETLTKEGANLRLSPLNGCQPIHIAATKNRVQIVKSLMELGVSPDTVSVCKINLKQE